MAKLLAEQELDRDHGYSIGTFSITVDGTKWCNSSIKFWTSLLDEATIYFPHSDTLLVETSAEKQITSRDLEPSRELEDSVQTFNTSTLAQVFTQAIRQMELYGPPQPVQAWVYQQNTQLARKTLPLECVDADLFLHLTAWLLYLSGIPEHRWNAENVSGDISAIDNCRGFRYGMLITFHNNHIHEGLFRRKIEFNWRCT